MEKLVLNIQNMVCDRCEMVVETALTALGLQVDEVRLGRAEVTRKEARPSMQEIEKELQRFNFGLLKDEEAILAEKVKTALIELVDSGKLEEADDFSISEFLSRRLARNYSSVSRVFSGREELTIEKYFIRLRIEKAKELVEYGRLSFSEIAYRLGYKNLQHLSRQFKQITGMSMSSYRKLKDPQRTPLDKL